jgi:glycerophosphoryl diester phosphodiesterase
MDVVLSADAKIVVSHEAWMNHEIASKPNGEAISDKEEKLYNLFSLSYAEIAAFDCGKRGHPRFNRQVAQAVTKPTLEAVVTAVRDYCKEKQKPMPRFNIEIKTEGAKGDGVFHPIPSVFAKAVLDEITRLNIHNLTCVQSFDVRILQIVKELDEKITMALLVENKKGIAWNLKNLGFTPDIYSCYYLLLTKMGIRKCHKKGMKVIPWTVNTNHEMQALIAMGVDGIITDYPDLIKELKKNEE